MKILQVVASMNPADGGVTAGVAALVDALESIGVHSELAVMDDPAAPWLLPHAGAVHAFGPRRRGFSYGPGFRAWLDRHLGDYDAVVMHGLWSYPSLALWRAARHATTPYVVFTHGMLDPWFRRHYPLKHLKKLLYWSVAQGPALRAAAAVLFTCEEERLLARGCFPGYLVREEVVGFGTAPPPLQLDAAREAFLDHFPRLRGRRMIVFMGRIHEKKGCDLLLRAWADACRAAPDIELVVAGPDQMGLRADLERLVHDRGIADRVTWAGMLHEDLKWGAMAAAEAFILPSHQENFGVVVAEALACGTPVLISDKVNIWREIERAGAGFVAPDTLDGTRALLRRWIALPAPEREAMRDRARACYAADFRMQGVARRVADLLAGLAPAARGEPA